MNQVNESEIRQIIADVMRDTGIRIDTDDPVIRYDYHPTPRNRTIGSTTHNSTAIFS